LERVHEVTVDIRCSFSHLGGDGGCGVGFGVGGGGRCGGGCGGPRSDRTIGGARFLAVVVGPEERQVHREK